MQIIPIDKDIYPKISRLSALTFSCWYDIIQFIQIRCGRDVRMLYIWQLRKLYRE